MILSPEYCGCPLEDPGASLVDSAICSGTLFMVLVEAYLKGRCNIASPCRRIRSVPEVKPEYDFVVVGAGSAGSIVASRLAENKKFKVLLLEAGGNEPIGARPPGFYRTYWQSEELNWGYHTVPADYCLEQDGKGCEWPRGKGLGGSSLLNGMMYHRGHPKDYDDWVKEGATGWSWKENLPYFDMTEGNRQIGSLVSSKYHSDKGPLPVQQFNYQPKETKDFLEAIKQAGFEEITDMNNPNTPVGFMIAQTFNDNGQRYTTARAYLESNPRRPNLDVKLNAHVSKVVFNKRRAKGVEFIDENGHTKYVGASKEVILSAGALNTPQILMLSGIGPRDILAPLKIPIVADLPVGKPLRNHYGMTLYYRLTKVENTDVLDWNVLTEYLLTRQGPMSSTAITQLTGLLYSSYADKKQKQPDLQYFFNGYYAECSEDGMIGNVRDPSAGGRNVSANVALLLPRSEGYMTINSTDPFAKPLFFPGYFQHPQDMRVLREGANNLRRIFESDIMKKKFGAELDESTTQRCCHLPEWSAPWVECMARVHTDPQNHQTSTAAIGRVVDPKLRVLGVEGLRVIDASAIPKQVTGNPQGSIMMVAERGADFIKNTWR